MKGFLSVQPSELKFPVELNKQSSCAMKFVNETDQYMAFRVKTNQPEKYCVRPNKGVVSPNSVCDFTVTMQAQKEVRYGMQCNDKFLVQSVIARNGAADKAVTPDMFNKNEGKLVKEYMCRVIYVPAYPVPEGDAGRTCPDNVRDLMDMSTGQFLSMQPSELKFPFELKKQSSCPMQLVNETNQYIAFKVKTNQPEKYCVRPNYGVVPPNSLCGLSVTMQAQTRAPPGMQCNDKFLVQTVIAPNGSTDKDVTPDMFNKEDGKLVNEFKSTVAYVPVNTPYPVPEGDKRQTCRRSSADNVNGSRDVSTGYFLSMQPSELKFPFELMKRSSCSMQLTNKTDQYIAFKVKTKKPDVYCVRPHTGVVLPNSVCNFTVTMQAQTNAPPDMRCNDQFLVQSVIAPRGATAKDVTPDMFDKVDGKLVNEHKIGVAYVPVNTPSSSATDNVIGASIVSHALQVLESLNQSMPNRLSTEVHIVSKFQHPNGCREDLVLKYEFYPNGGLEEPLVSVKT